jgi:ATP-dependent DNA helicase RecG
MQELTALLTAPESEATERKESWGDDCLKVLAALANTRGGTLIVGVADDGHIVGWNGDGKEQERIANQIVTVLHVHPLSMTVETHVGRTALIIEMARAASPVAIRGRYYRRVGNSTRDVSEESLPRFLLERTGQSWDALPCEAQPDALDEKTVADFAVLAKPRLPDIGPSDGIERILGNLELLTPDGRLLRAAPLLFGRQREPQRVAVSAQVHMGRFKDTVTIVDDKMFGGNLFVQLNAVMTQFRQYLQVRYEFHKEMGERSGLEAAQRIEIWDYPLDALREAVANALLHRDYTDTGQMMIQVFDDSVVISNPGGLPDDLTVEDLRRPHRSHPRNPLLAQVFYYASLIERWGSGTTRMAQLCRAQGLPEPEFVTTPHTFVVTFRKDPYMPERLRQLGLRERQIQAVRFAQEPGSLSNADYRNLTGVSDETARQELRDLVAKGILHAQGKGRTTRYVLGNVGD